MKNYVAIYMLVSAMTGFGQLTQTTNQKPVTVDQLRSWMFTPEMNSLRAKALNEQLHTRVPAWFPESLLRSIDQEIEHSDMAAIALPFYQPCVTEKQADVMVKLSQANIGQSIQENSLNEQSAARQRGATTEAQVDSAYVKTEQKTAALAPQQKQRILRSFTAAQRNTLASFLDPKLLACMKEATASTSKALGDYGTAVTQQQIDAHSDLMQKARADFQHAGK